MTYWAKRCTEQMNVKTDITNVWGLAAENQELITSCYSCVSFPTPTRPIRNPISLDYLQIAHLPPVTLCFLLRFTFLGIYVATSCWVRVCFSTSTFLVPIAYLDQSHTCPLSIYATTYNFSTVCHFMHLVRLVLSSTPICRTCKAKITMTICYWLTCLFYHQHSGISVFKFCFYEWKIATEDTRVSSILRPCSYFYDEWNVKWIKEIFIKGDMERNFA